MPLVVFADELLVGGHGVTQLRHMAFAGVHPTTYIDVHVPLEKKDIIGCSAKDLFVKLLLF
jgi:hypothetical protein